MRPTQSKVPLLFRPATKDDLPDLVEMLAGDKLGAQREDVSIPLNQRYLTAFNAIHADPNNELVIVEVDGQPAGMLQLTFIPYLTHTGSWRCLVEGVRIHPDFRGQGLGTELFAWVFQRAQERGCRIVQLTSDKQRPEAIKFYERLGFQATHEGFKYYLTAQG